MDDSGVGYIGASGARTYVWFAASKWISILRSDTRRLDFAGANGDFDIAAMADADTSFLSRRLRRATTARVFPDPVGGDAR